MITHKIGLAIQVIDAMYKEEFEALQRSVEEYGIKHDVKVSIEQDVNFTTWISGDEGTVNFVKSYLKDMGFNSYGVRKS